MDEEIAKWILEFLLRQPIDERIINGVLSSLPLKDEDDRLKKTLLLRKIEFEVSNDSISEKILDLLEIIEELDHKEGKSASDSMKEAYCAVAVDCTVRLLQEKMENNGQYFEAVKRIWRERVCKMESLASEETSRMSGEIEAAVWDSEACGKLLKMNTRNEALNSVRAYLAAEWRSLGPTFLELVAAKAGNALEELRSGGIGGGAVASANPCRESAASGEEIQESQTSVRRKRTAVRRSKRGKGAKISEVDEGNKDELTSKVDNMPVPDPEVDRVPDAAVSSSLEVRAVKNIDLPDSLQTAQTSTKDADNLNCETHVENQTCPKVHATPEVERVQEALKLSSMELRASVRDPLPDALQAAITLTSTSSMAINKISSESLKENAKKKENSPQDTRAIESQNKMKLRSMHTLMMDPNGTAQTFEWDDSIDNLPGESPKRPRLPSPKESKPSALKNYEDAKLIRRRVRKKWTPEEEDTLRTGVQKFGRGNWKLILNSYREIFQERTEVDLKDKWRNMTR